MPAGMFDADFDDEIQPHHMGSRTQDGHYIWFVLGRSLNLDGNSKQCHRHRDEVKHH